HLGLQRDDPGRPLRVTGDVVRQAGVVAEPGRLDRGGERNGDGQEAPSDLIVVGAGAAGLFAALTAAQQGARVTLVSAPPLAETASYWAQGGLCAAAAAE